MINERFNRRRFLELTAAGAAVVVVGCGDDGDDGDAPTATPGGATPAASAQTGSTPASTATGTTLPATPACGDNDDETIEQTEGPYFTPNSPEKVDLREAGMAGEPLTISGTVVTTACEPVAGALLDFWQADNDGMYDNEGYKLRGHQFSDSAGGYSLTTIKPGLYPGRTRHIHVKVQAPNGPVLTTQLYFPGEADNASDGIFDESLVLDVAADGRTATFTFVLER